MISLKVITCNSLLISCNPETKIQSYHFFFSFDVYKLSSTLYNDLKQILLRALDLPSNRNCKQRLKGNIIVFC